MDDIIGFPSRQPTVLLSPDDYDMTRSAPSAWDYEITAPGAEIDQRNIVDAISGAWSFESATAVLDRALYPDPDFDNNMGGMEWTIIQSHGRSGDSNQPASGAMKSQSWLPSFEKLVESLTPEELKSMIDHLEPGPIVPDPQDTVNPSNLTLEHHNTLGPRLQAPVLPQDSYGHFLESTGPSSESRVTPAATVHADGTVSDLDPSLVNSLDVACNIQSPSLGRNYRACKARKRARTGLLDKRAQHAITNGKVIEDGVRAELNADTEKGWLRKCPECNMVPGGSDNKAKRESILRHMCKAHRGAYACPIDKSATHGRWQALVMHWEAQHPEKAEPEMAESSRSKSPVDHRESVDGIANSGMLTSNDLGQGLGASATSLRSSTADTGLRPQGATLPARVQSAYSDLSDQQPADFELQAMEGILEWITHRNFGDFAAEVQRIAGSVAQKRIITNRRIARAKALQLDLAKKTSQWKECKSAEAALELMICRGQIVETAIRGRISGLSSPDLPKSCSRCGETIAGKPPQVHREAWVVHMLGAKHAKAYRCPVEDCEYRTSRAHRLKCHFAVCASPVDVGVCETEG